MLKSLTAAAMAASLPFAASAQPNPDIAELIAQARTIIATRGDEVWSGYAAAPDTMILIDGEQEYLLCHEGAGADFEPIGTEPVTGCDLRVRPQSFAPYFLASFPAVDMTPTIVMGTPEATSRSEPDWMVTILHEHLHQMQDAQPGAFQAAMALDLHGGDQTGMWMLNYPFPYQHPATASAAHDLAASAHAALQARGTAEFETLARRYSENRQAFLAGLDPADARYYEFQVWKEGVARWTELAILRAAAPSDTALASLYEAQAERLITSIEAADLASQERVAFYAMGAAEAEILETLDPSWRARYFEEMFRLDAAFEAALGE